MKRDTDYHHYVKAFKIQNDSYSNSNPTFMSSMTSGNGATSWCLKNKEEESKEEQERGRKQQY